MATAILIVLFLFFIIVYFIIRSKQSKTKKIERVRNAWGKLKSQEPDFPLIEAYAMRNKKKCFHELSNQTICDLDFYELFPFVDRTVSRTGEQFLFDKLKKPSNDIHALNELDKHVSFLAQNRLIREEISAILSDLDSKSAYYIPTLLEEKLIDRPSWFNILKIDSILVLLMLLLSPLYPVLLIWLIPFFAINLFFHFRNKNNTFQFIKSFPQLNLLINVSKKIFEKKIPNSVSQTDITESITSLKSFQKKFGILNFGQSKSDELSQIFWVMTELVKALFLLEVHTFYSLTEEIKNKQKQIDTLFQFVGYTDTCISIASMREGMSAYCKPTFIDHNKKLSAKNVYHPLVIGCVANSIDIQSKSILITGSNMSGKTTFLRTIAINTLFAQTIFTCFAEAFYTPILKIFSSVRIDDNLLEGKSYYFEEVNVMHNLVKQVETGFQNLFILDEVFKGTNTIERMASGKAILSYLNKGSNIVLAATHDIELSDMLTEEYSLYHFSETIQHNELSFDYEIKTGQLTTRNAIKILELSNYPKEIIEEANKLSKQLSLPITHIQ